MLPNQKGFFGLFITILVLILITGTIIGGSFYIKYSKPELLGNLKNTSYVTQKPAASVTTLATPSDKPQQISKLPIATSSGALIHHKNISFIIPHAFKSTKETDNSMTLKYGENLTLVSTFIPADSLINDSDLALSKDEFLDLYVHVKSNANISVQKKAIEKFSGSFSYDIARDPDTSDALKFIKKHFLNLPNYTYSVINQNGLTLIQGKYDYTILSVEDSKGNLYMIVIRDEPTLKSVLSSLKVS